MILVCANQKGGVGKTTTAIHLATGFSLAGKKTILLDLDPQKNSLLSLTQEGINNCQLKNNSETPKPIHTIKGFITKPASEGLIIATPTLDPEVLSIEPIKKRAECLVIDCPPSLSGWTPIAIGLASNIIIPLQCEFLSLNGLAEILAAIKEINPTRIKNISVLPNMVESKNENHLNIISDIDTSLPGYRTRSTIPRDESFSLANSFGKSLFHFKPTSRGCRAFADLTREFLNG